MPDGSPRPIVRDYPGLIAAFRARKHELGWSDKLLEQRAGFADGAIGKMIGPKSKKMLGPMSFGLLLQSLGVAFVMVETEPAEQLKVTPSNRRNRVDAANIRITSESLRKRAKYEVLSDMAAYARAAKAHNPVPEKERVRSARHAARVRWAATRRARSAKHAAMVRWAKGRRRKARLPAAAALPAAT